MALYRNVSTSFWTDPMVVDDFSPEEKLIFLYLLTNPHTNLCGCYELSLNQMALETGYDRKTVRKLLDGLQKHKCVIYAEDTKEVLLVNWHKYNWTNSEKFRKPLAEQLSRVKTVPFREYLTDVFDGADTIRYPYGIDTVSIRYTYGMDRAAITNTNTITNTITSSKEEKEKEREESDPDYGKIIDYLNSKAGTSYRANSKDTRSHIHARFDDGYTLEDFYKVIDNKVEEWKGTDMEKFLRPSTLFGTKFESYLNQRKTKKPLTKFDNFESRSYDYGTLELQLLKAQGAI